MCYRNLSALAALIALSASLLHADDLVWTDYNGTGDLPTGGNVRLAWKSGGYEILVDTEEKMQAVEGWDNLSFAADDSTYLTFANTSRAVTLKANVIGTAGRGHLRAIGSAGLVLAGDNRARGVSFDFTDSRVTVANEYGLGGPDSSAVGVFYSQNATIGDLVFRWAGQKAFTNHVALVFDCETKYSAKDGKMYLGSVAADEYFVQDADFYLKTPGATDKKVKFRNNFEQISGSFGIQSYLNSYFCTAGDADAVVKFSGTTRFTTANPNNAAQKGTWYVLPGGRVNYRFGSTGGFHCNQIAINNANVICDVDDPFRSDVLHPDVIGVSYFQPYANAQPGNVLNLNGHDATIPYIHPNDAATESSTTYYCLTSAVPATLTLLAAEGQVTVAEKAGAFEIAGEASLVVDNHRSNIYARKVSKTAGSLTVRSGRLTYRFGGGWDGGPVTIAGGVVDAESAASFASGKVDLTIVSGSLNLHSDAPVSFASATIGGTELDPGDYTVESLRDDYGLGAFVTGDNAAVLSVGSASEWTGWPSEPGASAVVPKNTVVYIDDADISKVATVGKIVLGIGSTVVCRNTQALSVAAPISGYGEFRIKDVSARVTLSGDNSKLLSPGHFVIDNSTVTVANEFGLGSENTAAVALAYGASGSISFENPNGPAFTNRVALTVSYASGASNAILGSETADTYFVQANDLTLPKLDNAYKFYFKNNFEMIDGRFSFAAYGNGNFFSYTAGTAVIRFSEDAVVDMRVGASGPGSWYQLGTSKLHFGQVTPLVAAMVAVNGTELYLDREGVLAGLNTLGEYVTAAGTTVADLGGHVHTVGVLNGSYQYNPIDNPQYYGVIRGVNGSKLVMNGGTLSKRDVTLSFKVSGAASLEMAWEGGAVRLRNFVSDTTGDLVVSAGTLGFAVNGGWGAGNVLVKGTGILDVDSDKAFTSGLQALTVRDSGKIVVHAGAVATFEILDLGGKTFEPGVYTIAQLKDDPDVAQYVDGDDTASIKVNAVWHGWPATPGASAFVPDNETVTVAADDLAKIAQLGKLVLGVGSTVRFADLADPVTLAAQTTGSGIIEVSNCAGLRILGDSSALSAPGAFHIANTPSVVSNEFGLGSAATGPTVFDFGANGSLDFGLADRSAFTNHVALTLGGERGTGVRNVIVGSASPDETFVQANDLKIKSIDNEHRLYFRNRFEMIAGTFGAASSGANKMFFTYAVGSDVAKVAFSGTAAVDLPGVSWYCMGQFDFDMGAQGNNTLGSFIIHTTQLRLCADEALSSVNTLGDYMASYSYLDLNGYNQTVGTLSNTFQYDPQKDTSHYSIVTSAVPAKLTVDGRGKTAAWTSPLSTLYTGAVSLEMASAIGRLDLYNTKSDTTGALIVSAGTVGFRNKAGWLGDVTVRGSGVLDIDAVTIEDGVFGTASGATQTRTRLNVEDGGTIWLESGVTYVDTISTNGVLLVRDTYSKDNCDWIRGDGSLRARHGAARGMTIILK